MSPPNDNIDPPTTSLSSLSLTATTRQAPLTDADAQAAHVTRLLTPNPDPSPPPAPFPSLPTERDAARWSLFGRSGHPQAAKATRASWKKTSPFDTPVSVPWRVPLPTSQAVMRLLHGYRPEGMEDKWFVYADGPVASPGGGSAATVNFHRSWTGRKVASVKLELGGLEGGEWTGEVAGLVYEGGEEGGVVAEEEGGEAMAKFIVVEVCGHVLGVKLEPVDKVEEPRRWREVLAARPFEATKTEETTTAYKGTMVSKETLADMLRLGNKGLFRLS
ncbi:hypothetical protein QBC39DRAFT_266010 [Podospora conica]|nr:hypothetical protein QBC39DRAFT_266010 [Schizothecium conicum]